MPISPALERPMPEAPGLAIQADNPIRRVLYVIREVISLRSVRCRPPRRNYALHLMLLQAGHRRQ